MDELAKNRTKQAPRNPLGTGGWKKGRSGNPGGRPKGVPNKINREARERASASGELPLEYMLRVMRDPAALTERRDGMAIAAAPYLHAKLMAIRGDEETPEHIAFTIKVGPDGRPAMGERPHLPGAPLALPNGADGSRSPGF